MTSVTDVFGGMTTRSRSMPADEERTSDFSALLGDLQSAQVAAAANVNTAMPATGPDSGGTSESARRKRIDSETNAARQGEQDAHDTRLADPSSVENGTVSGRSERLVAERAEAGQPVPPTSAEPAPHAPATAQTSSTTAAASTAKLAPGQQPETGKMDASRSDANGQAQATEPAAAVSTTTQRTPQSTENQAAAPVTPAAESAPVVVAVSTAGAARATGSSQGADVAQQIGRMLAARTAGSTDAVQPTSATPERNSANNQRVTVADKDKPSTPDKSQRGETTRADKASFQRLVNQVRMNLGTRRSQATIRLSPPDLGRIRVNVKMVDQTLRVRVEAETPKARALLAGRAHELTQSLRDRDLTVERFEIVPANQSSHNDAQNANVAPRDDWPASGQEDRTRGRHDGSPMGDDPADEAVAPSAEEQDSISAEDPRVDLRV
jgi:flagellar hook-length control protein FliK